MSFRAFIYYCALCGGWAALAGWLLGRLSIGENADPLGGTGIKGMYLGLVVTVALGFVDALWTFSLRQFAQVAPRVLVSVVVGTIGGLLGGVLGQKLFDLMSLSLFLVLGWAITGLLIGASLGTFDVLSRFVRQEDMQGARRKIVRGALGGTVGGLLGGLLYLLMQGLWAVLLPSKPAKWLWSPSAMGFVVLGLCIGLMIGLAQVIFREVWVRVEAGVRAGRELILTRPIITIGRAEACDIGLFGDPTIERLHARILQQGERYLIADAGSAIGTFLNDERVTAPTPLRPGDAIRIGKSTLRFWEKQKRG